MKSFSNMKPKEEKNFKNKKDDVVYSDDFVKVIKYEDYSIVSEKDCVICIIYLIEMNQIVIRQEYIPSFKYADGQEYHISLVGGGIEMGESPEQGFIKRSARRGWYCNKR